MLRFRYIIPAVAALAVAATATADPVITQVNSTTFERSRRIAIEGTGFGAETPTSAVVVAGLEALTSTWTDTRIVAYVPEAAPLGSVPLHVSVADQPSNDVVIDVVPRTPDGRVKWTFEVDSNQIQWRPALAPDGSIYVHTTNITDGLVYKLAPDGALLWITKVNWNPYGPPAAGPDGAAYVGSISSAYRISPQGGIDWMFHTTNSGDGIHMVPHPGPDGMLYGAYQSGIGAYSLDPADGSLVWSNAGEPSMYDWTGSQGTETVFGRGGTGQPLDRFYVMMDGSADIHAFTLDGDQLWARGIGNESTEPAIGTDGTLYIPSILARYVSALDPETGDTLWQFQPGGSAEIRGIEIDANDDLYYYASGKLQRLATNGGPTLVWSTTTGLILNEPSLSPDGTTIVASGVPNYGQPGVIRAYAAATGDELWTIPLPGEVSPADRVIGAHHARITPDSSTAYLSTYTASWNITPDTTSFLYAIALDDEPGPVLPGDANRDGRVNIDDVIAIVLAWGPCPAAPAACDADVDGTGWVDVDDVVMAILNWS